MIYAQLVILIVILIFLIYSAKGKRIKDEENSLANIKRSVITTIFVNSLIFTPFILVNMNGHIIDVIFFWLINFIVPYLGFQKLFK